MNTQNYTLEKHLEAICREDSDYNVLLAAWRLNKENLTLALSTISSSFPHYSRHDATHSSKILDNIQRLLGQDRIERLGATDTFLILMAAMTHDLGMYLYYGMLEEKWKEDKMEALLKNYSQSDDKTIAQAARLLLNFKRCTEDPAQSYLWALEIKNAVTLIIAHQMRGGHEKRSAQYIEDDDFIAKLTHGFHFELLPSRYLTLLSKVAYLHGTNFDEVMKILKRDADGYKGDYIHPRFIACMIRMGDLLDIDSNRFNDFASSMIKEVPESSKAHFDKHQAVKHLLISPSGIEAELDCKTDASYRVARQVFDWLEKEVEKLSRNWSRIAPDDLGGLPPVLHTDSINILFNGTRTRPELMNLRFDISSKKTFEMLKGGAIYKNPGRVFLREIVQNAMDATKLQIWQDLKDGYYLPCKLENPDREIKTICDIKFSDDIPADVYDKYPIILSVEFIEKKEDEKKDEKDKKNCDKRCEEWLEKTGEKRIEGIRIICEDYGTGISEESLIRMTSKVGESRKADKDYEKTIKEMPFFLQPTAVFGLGLQTIFYVADEFIVETSCPDKTSRRIIFRTSTNGSYCSVDKEEIDMHRGTKVIIEIGKDHFGNLFELDKNELQKLFDYPENIGYYIPTKIDSYVEKEFNQTENIPFYYKSDYSSYTSKRSKDCFQHVDIGNDEEKRYRVSYNDQSRFGILFRIEDNLVGSIMEIWYTNDLSGVSFGSPFQTSTLDKGFQHIILRGVPLTKLNYSYSKHIDVRWNLFCRELDAYVSISRDELLPQGIKWCNKTMDELMPIIISCTHQAFNTYFGSADFKKNNEIKKEFLQKQYSSLRMINWQMPEPIAMNYGPIKDLKTPEYLISNNKFEAIHVEDVLTTTDVLMIDTYFEKIKEANVSIDSEIVIWNSFKDTIPSSFVCEKLICVIDEQYLKTWGYYLRKDSTSTPHTIEISDEDFRHYEIVSSSLIPGFRVRGHKKDGFETIVVSEEAPSLGYKLPYHCNCWIYPLSLNTYSKVIEGTKSISREELKQKLETEWIQKLVPDYIVKLIQKHSIRKNENPSKEEIYNAYIRFILDNKFGFEKPSKQKK